MSNKAKTMALIIFLLTATILSAKDDITNTETSQYQASAGQSFAYIPDQSANTVSVIDIDTLTIVKTINVGNNPFGVAATPDGRLIYVTNTDDDSISVIDGKTLTVIETITVGDGPRGIAVSLDQETVVTANTHSNSISVLYTKDNLVITQPMGNGFIQYGPTEVGFFQSNLALVRSETKVSMSRLNLNRNSLLGTTQIFNANRSYSYEFDLKGLTHFPGRLVQRRVLIASPEENKLLFFNDSLGQYKVAFDNIYPPSDMVLSKEGNKAYVAIDNPGSISVFTVNLNQDPPMTLDSIIPNINDAKEIGLNADETRLVIYSASASEKKLTTINTQTNQVIGSVNLPLSSHVLGDFISTIPSSTVSSVIYNSQYNFPELPSIIVVDLESNQEYLQIPINEGRCCAQILEHDAEIVSVTLANWNERKVFSPDGRYIYTSKVRGVLASDRDNTVAVFDRVLNKEISVIDLGPFGDRPDAIAVSPDGAFVYTINISSDTVSVIQTNDNSLVDTVAIGPGPGVSPGSNIKSAITVSLDGTKLYLATNPSELFSLDYSLLIYDISSKVIESIIPLNGLPDYFGDTESNFGDSIALVLSPDGNTLYIGSRVIVVVDLLTNTVTHNIKSLMQTIDYMSLSSDSKRLVAFTINSGFGHIAVIDTTNFKVIRYITSENPSEQNSLNAGIVADIPPMTDLIVTVDNNLDVLPPSENIIYQITIDNSGLDDVIGAAISADIPAGLTLIGWTCSGSGVCENNSGNSSNILEFIDLTAGSQIVFEVTVAVQVPEIIIDFSANVQMPNGIFDISLLNNEDSDRDSIGVFASGFE